MGVIWFVGVSTGQSTVNEAFPLWMKDCGLDVRLTGRDLPPGSPREAYRELMAGLAADDDALGAVITTHKLAVFRSSRDLFSSLDPIAEACGEVSAIRRDEGRLTGFARDPISVGRVVDEIWPDGEHLICLGAGGTAVALGRHLLSRSHPPVTLTFADRSEEALRHITGVLGDVRTVAGGGPWDDLVAGSPAGTLVVNATGMGKDRPGSPLSPGVRFPAEAVVWELNYRGDLSLLEIEHGGKTYDGWDLFCHGWAAALGPILDLPGEAHLAHRFAELAEHLRRKP